jgi:hypothetical protein
MDASYPPVDAPATPEYVLAVLRDNHRQQCQFDPEAEPSVNLSFSTTVADWRLACDLVGWRKLGRAENGLWGIACSDDDWRAVLEPATERTLADVCGLIAQHATAPTIRPWRLLGAKCDAAGAFLTVRSLLKDAGASVDEIAPSTRLGTFARRYAYVFLGPISRLAPGALPPVRIRTPAYDAAVLSHGVGLLCSLVGLLLSALVGSWISLVVATGFAVCAVAYPLIWITARYTLPASVEFEPLRTFGDLATAIATAKSKELKQQAPDGS